jgi:hypothetical protein
MIAIFPQMRVLSTDLMRRGMCNGSVPMHFSATR